jgi:hypothetical protein
VEEEILLWSLWAGLFGLETVFYRRGLGFGATAGSLPSGLILELKCVPTISVKN